jgi:hypothetical protein
MAGDVHTQVGYPHAELIPRHAAEKGEFVVVEVHGRLQLNNADHWVPTESISIRLLLC